MTVVNRVTDLARREFLPMGATLAMWAVVAIAIGHADAARLLASTVMVRAIQMLTKLSAGTAVRRRLKAPAAIQRQARQLALNLQSAALVCGMLILVLLVEGMKAIGQHQIASYLPFIALGMPARYLRDADVQGVSPYSRLALAGGGLAMAGVAWAAHWPIALFGLAFGIREWFAYLAIRFWPRKRRPTKKEVAEPLHFAEVARYTSIAGRQMLTYRLSKTLLTVFGPFGNAAARTGRGLNLHKKIEPYLPHHLGTFCLFAAGAWGAAVFLALRSGEPAAMVGAAGLAQIGAATANVVLLWPYFPSRGDEVFEEEDDDE
jgi:hypothetical protein